MFFKKPEIEEEFKNAPPMLKMVADYFVLLSLGYGITPIVTRILEKIEGESGVHQDYRAIDFRDERGVGGERLYTPEQTKAIVEAINERFCREDGKLVAIHHAFVNHGEPASKRAPYHFHLQIPYAWKVYPKKYVLKFSKL